MNIGFIGIGKIATAVIEGFCGSDLEPSVLRLSPRNEANARRLAGCFPGVQRMEDNQSVVDQSEVVILALRPQQAVDILTSLKFREEQRIISLIPLIRKAELERLVRPAKQICRAIPLPPVANRRCPVPMFGASPEDLQLFGHIGQPLAVHDENHLHALWTLTCLITPYYHLLEELSNWTRSHGVDAETANRYIADLFESLSYTAHISNPIDFGELARHAATPNGLNERTGKEIRDAGAHEAYQRAAEGILHLFPTGDPESSTTSQS